MLKYTKDFDKNKYFLQTRAYPVSPYTRNCSPARFSGINRNPGQDARVVWASTIFKKLETRIL